MSRLERTLRMRHHAEDIARIVEDAGDVPRGSVDLTGIAEGYAAFALDPVERVRVVLLIAVLVSDRDRDFLARRIGAGEDRLAVFDLQADRAANEVEAGIAH